MIICASAPASASVPVWVSAFCFRLGRRFFPCLSVPIPFSVSFNDFVSASVSVTIALSVALARCFSSPHAPYLHMYICVCLCLSVSTQNRNKHLASKTGAVAWILSCRASQERYRWSGVLLGCLLPGTAKFVADLLGYIARSSEPVSVIPSKTETNGKINK